MRTHCCNSLLGGATVSQDRVLNRTSRLVDGSPGLRALLVEQCSIRADEAGSGPFDLIFCDLMMPNTSGMSFYEKLAKTSPRLASGAF